MEVYWKKSSGSYHPDTGWEFEHDMNGILVGGMCVGGGHGTNDRLGMVALPDGRIVTTKLDVLRHKEVITEKKYEDA